MILMNIVWDYKLDDATYVSYRAAYGLTPGNVLDLPDTDNQMLGFRWTPDGKYFAAYLHDSKNGCEEQKYPFRIVVVNAETNEIVGQYPLGPVPAYVGYSNGSMRGMDIIWVPQN